MKIALYNSEGCVETEHFVSLLAGLALRLSLDLPVHISADDLKVVLVANRLQPRSLGHPHPVIVPASRPRQVCQDLQ